MKRLVSHIATWVAVVMFLGSCQALAAESLSAEEFARRCADAGGNLTLDQNVRVDGGSAELDECQVTVGSFRLEINRARLSSTGFLRVFGESGGEIRVVHSALAQSEQAAGPMNILLRAHRVLIEATTLDFSGTVHLETGQDDRGEVHVVNSTLRSSAADIHIGSSGRGHEGRTRIEESRLSAEVDISILSSSLQTAGRGEVTVEDSALDSSGTMTLQTGDEGRTEARENSSMHAAGALTIISGSAGKTVARDNRIVGEESAHILSGGRTNVQENDFTGSGGVSIEGPRCQARNNVPAVECTEGTLHLGLFLVHFDGEDVSRPEHVRTEDNPSHVRRERDVWLEAVIVPRQVHQLFRLQDPWLDEVFGVRKRLIGAIRNELRAKQVNPLPVARRGHA
jgi:hypothetical protein